MPPVFKRPKSGKSRVLSRRGRIFFIVREAKRAGFWRKKPLSTGELRGPEIAFFLPEIISEGTQTCFVFLPSSGILSAAETCSNSCAAA